MFCCLHILPAPLQLCMGMCFHRDVTEESKKAKVQNTKIEEDLSEQAKTEMNVVKMLMLGAAETGKSTLIKQIKIIHSQGFSTQELLRFKPAVMDNLQTSMKFVLQGMGTLRINLANKNNKTHARSILSCSRCLGDDQELLPFVAHAFYALWADQGVRAAAARGHEFGLNDSALYFFDNISRIIAPGYVPTETDVLRVRVRTSGIIETQFQVNEVIYRADTLMLDKGPGDKAVGLKLLKKQVTRSRVVDFLSYFWLYDVGGQRSKRRKWLRCFDGVQAVLFVVALSSYDLTLTDDPSVNRLQESLELFSSICSNTAFESSSLILFMNKTDLFQKKVLHSGRHVRFYICSYTGADADVDAAAHHITAMFSACNRRPNKPVYHHFTTATDTTNVQVVFHMVIEQIVRKNLADVELL